MQTMCQGPDWAVSWRSPIPYKTSCALIEPTHCARNEKAIAMGTTCRAHANAMHAAPVTRTLTFLHIALRILLRVAPWSHYHTGTQVLTDTDSPP